MSLLVRTKMEVFLYNSTICRLCGEENDIGTQLYSCQENSQNLSEVINTYLPIRVSDDGQLPQTICPGCTIQLEATVEFMNLIINGQKIIRVLHQREKDYKKSMLNTGNEQEIITENIVYEVNTSDGVYQVEHPIALQVAGLEKPKRKRGRPPKKQKTPEELAAELANRERELKASKKKDREDEPSGKRKRKTPTRFREAVQGKELEKIFIEEGVIDEESDHDVKPEVDIEPQIPVSKEPEVIGHMENSGELVVVVKGKGRGRPKGRMRPMRSECAICGMHFSCAGRYMSHVAAHGPVAYRCGCGAAFRAKLRFDAHQRAADHTGLTVVPCDADADADTVLLLEDEDVKEQPVDKQEADSISLTAEPAVTSSTNSLPDLNPLPATNADGAQTVVMKSEDDIKHSPTPVEIPSSPSNSGVKNSEDTSSDVVAVEDTNEDQPEESSPTKGRLKCNHCDKTFSTKQSKSLHIKATHQGLRPYACGECGAQFAYPRSLALHAVSHRRRHAAARGFACDLCGKVLNHPSSVVYHKEAVHAGQRYVCGKCGKLFKHKQLLQRHQLVHSALRPYTCKTCDASFKTKANLLNHQLLHSGVKKFSCEICKHRFAHKTSLTLHMRWHTGQKPYSCKTCGKSFSQKGNLSEHERIHTGEKPFQCSVCPRRFTTSSQHRLHARRHQHQHQPARSGTRAAGRRTGAGAGAGSSASAGASSVHVCGWCGRELGSRWALMKHARQHTGERPFRCTHCPRAFADASNLNKHKKQVHKQMSLLAPPGQPPAPAQAAEPARLAAVQVSGEDELEERIIYVTYDVDEPNSPAFHILDPEQAEELDESKVLTTCELYSGPSLLVPQPELQLQQLQQLELQHDHDHDQLDMQEPLVLDAHEHMPVTDEQGNPLHFTMQDGTRLAITSADGKSLQVITQDGQTIPVEINGYAEEEEVENPDMIVHQLNLQKTVEANVSSPVTHYFTIV